MQSTPFPRGRMLVALSLATLAIGASPAGAQPSADGGLLQDRKQGTTLGNSSCPKAPPHTGSPSPTGADPVLEYLETCAAGW